MTIYKQIQIIIGIQIINLSTLIAGIIFISLSGFPFSPSVDKLDLEPIQPPVIVRVVIAKPKTKEPSSRLDVMECNLKKLNMEFSGVKREIINLIKVMVKEDNITDQEYKEAFIKGIKHWEGFHSKRYTCSGGQTTIGYGFTGKELKGRSSISKKTASKELIEEVIPKNGRIVDRVVKVKLTPNQRMALTDFVFNFGEAPLKTLVNGKGRLNDGNYKSIETIMPKYRIAGGKVQRGLELRRAWAVKLWKGEICYNYGN